MKSVQLNITIDNLRWLLDTLNELPTKTGVFPLIADFKQQAENQLKAQEAPLVEAELVN
jgi:hypothetical protein